MDVAIETMPQKKVVVDVSMSDGNKINVNDVSTVSLRDIYMRLCACRDFEIKLQWERAVFLTAFLIACYAGYGCFMLSVHQHGYGCLSSLLVKCIPVAISFVGIVLSLLWVLMAKGSKAWYEHYEQAIAAFAKEYSSGYASGKGMVPEYMMAHRWYEMKGIVKNSMSDSFFKFNGGDYSVSKIVIAIGVCSLVLWSALFVLHCLVAIFGPVSCWCVLRMRYWLKVCLFAVLVIGSVYLVCRQLTKKLKSGYLEGLKVLLGHYTLTKVLWVSNDGAVTKWIKKQSNKAEIYIKIEKDRVLIYARTKKYEELEIKCDYKNIKLLEGCKIGELYSLNKSKKTQMTIRVINDASSYSTHNEVLDSMGIHLVLPHIEGAYVLPDKWMVWFPKISQQDENWVNRIVDCGNAIEERYDGNNASKQNNRNITLDYMRITYAREKDGRYRFKGIFGEGRQTGNKSIRFKKIADSCEIAFLARPIMQKD